MPMLRTIDRPTKDTLRPNATAASMICCTRSTLDAKHATITRPSAPRISRCSVGPISLSDGLTPGCSEFVESQRNRSTPASPSRDIPGRSVGRPSSGIWSSLMSPVASTVPGAGVQRDGQTAGDRVVHREVLALEHAVRAALPLGDLDEHRLDPMLTALLGDQRQGELRADDRNVAPQLQQMRDGPDVILVGMRDDDGLDLVEAVLDVPDVRQDQVDAGLVVIGEQHPAVDDQQPAEMLENGHVAADLADAAQCGDTKSTRRQWPRRIQRAVRPSREHPGGAHVGGQLLDLRRGGRHLRQPGSPTSMPCNLSAALAIVTPPSRFCASLSGPSVT